MKKMSVAAAVLAALVCVGSSQSFGEEKAAADASQTAPVSAPAPKYVCKHCNETADAPGKCPKCGKEMKKVGAPTTKPAKKKPAEGAQPKKEDAEKPKTETN